MELTRSISNKEEYNYLDAEDSKLYDELKDSKDPKDILIVKMIIDKATSCYASFCAWNR